MPRRSLVGLVLAGLVVGLVLTWWSPVAHAATITVTTTVDELLTGGGCSLREAIRAANLDMAGGGCPAGSGADTISLPAGTFKLTLAGRDEDRGFTGDLDITAGLTIVGAGASSTIIDGNGQDRVFEIPANVNVSISRVAIRNGLAAGDRTTSGIEAFGGGILNYGTLQLSDSVMTGNRTSIGVDIGPSSGGAIYSTGTAVLDDTRVEGNSAVGYDRRGSGGGITNAGGTLTLNESRVLGNTASVQLSGGAIGGGIHNSDGTVTVRDSSVSGNQALGGGSRAGAEPGTGGGIANGDTLELVRSTVSGNSATGGFGSEEESNGGGQGGGIWNTASLAVTDSTVSGNTAGGAQDFGGGRGGGIANRSGGTTTLRNSTVSGNRAAAGATLGGGQGGGIANTSTLLLLSSTVSNNSADGSTATANGTGGGINGSATIQNTILAGNTAVQGPNCAGTLSSLGYNLVGEVSGCTVTGDAPGTMTGVTASLGRLGNNGGPTQTHALLPGSLAIDNGTITDCPPTDQRGQARPRDGNRDGTVRCDIGAYEAAAVPSTPTPTATRTPTQTPTATQTVPPGSTPTATVRPINGYEVYLPLVQNRSRR